MHQGLAKSILEERLHEDCPQVLIEDAHAMPTKAEPLAKKNTRAQVIKDLLHRQQQQAPGPSEHQCAETTGYLRCFKCGVNTHKRVNEEAFQHFITSKCIDQAYPQPPQGHPSHSLWQKGEKVKCAQCGSHWNLDGEQHIITNQVLSKICKGAGTKGSPPLSEFFKKKSDAHSQAEGDHKPTAEHEPEVSTRPTPRRLHFPTSLDDRESMTDQAINDQVMTASDEEAGAEDHFTVDFF